MALELDGHVGAQDGYIKFDPVGGKLGDLPLPQSTLESAVEKMMASPENREKLRLPADISDIQIVNGQAVCLLQIGAINLAAKTIHGDCAPEADTRGQVGTTVVSLQRHWKRYAPGSGAPMGVYAM